ncbi:MAG: hypothetical protein ACRD2W_16415 [Acidimicrobiales bacterium]
MTALAAAVLALAGPACGDGDVSGSASPTTTATAVPTTLPPATAPPSTTATTAPAAATTTRPAAAATTTTALPTPATAIIGPDTVAGIPLGANKSAAIGVLGIPTVSGQTTDLSGATYDFLRWSLDGNRGLTLNFRTPSATSPLLTDWQVTAVGPTTALGIKVGDTASQVTAAYGPLQAFCCDSRVASVERNGGRLIVIVDNAGSLVRQLIGGDPAFWSRSIAD